ncbi:MAG TPA: hypothetical protein VFG45_00735 [Candidatus Nitrosocosmicus sp.]|nr:hypothetical protein [Candidatus Nitrosocosmicus sp.]
MNKDVNTVSKSICYFVLMISVILPLAILNLEKVLAQPQTISIKVGESPQVLEYNPSNGNIYVANENSDNVSLITTAHAMNSTDQKNSFAVS